MQLHLRSIATDMPIRPTVHRELPASFYKLLLNPRSRDLPSRPRIYQYAHKYPSSQNGDTLNWPYPPFRLGSIPGCLYLSGYERVFMKKRRLGEYSANEAISPRPISTKCSWKAGKTRSPRRIVAAGRQGRQDRSRPIPMIGICLRTPLEFKGRPLCC